MRMVDLLHRWGGGLLGIILALLGLSGAILVHREEWIMLPHADDPRLADPAVLGDLAARLLDQAGNGESLVFASDRFGLVQWRHGEAGFYASQTGEVVARWTSQWQRPELWLFDLHHHLLAGEAGETLAGIAGLAAVAFAVTGSLLWWRTRRTFQLRLWPARMTGPALRMHHRDLGIVSAPLLLFLALTGAMMLFRPVAGLVLAPWTSPAALERDLKPPRLQSGPLSPATDWRGIVAAAHGAFPDAELRIVSTPRKPGDPIVVRMRREAEWTTNGRTMLWFDAANGRLLGQRDALALQPGTRAFNLVYPLHAGKVGGLVYRLALTLGGLALFLLGALATWSFWFRRSRQDRAASAANLLAAGAE